jgi:preprotein translocase subunit YajC
MRTTLASTIAWAQPAEASDPSGAPATGEGQATGAGEGAEEPPPGMCGGMGSTSSIILMLAMFAVFYFLLIRPQQKKAKQRQKMLEAIKKGDEVVTNGGLIGRVTAITGNTLTLEISEKVRVRVVRSHVDRPMSAEPEGKK